MARADLAFFTFNRGIVSRLGAARADIKRLALGAKTMINWATRALGSMNIRPGLIYKASTRNNAAARHLEFVFSNSDKAIIELTTLIMRIRVNDDVVTRASVGTTITNGTFAANINNWTDLDDAGCVSQWVAPSYMELVGTGSAHAIRSQYVSIAGADRGVEHGLNITVVRGPVTVMIGATDGGDDILRRTDLDEGVHCLAFTPTVDFYVRVMASLQRKIWIDSITIAAAGAVEIATPWPAAALDYIRHAQSGDILFCACDGYRQQKIERRSTNGWSLVRYYTEDGPYCVDNLDPALTMTPSVTTGNGTLTAGTDYFRSTMVGAIFKVVHPAQLVTTTMNALAQATASIKVTGSDTARTVNWTLAGIAAGHGASLQFSTDNAVWYFFQGQYVADATSTFNDGRDGQTIYYRWIVGSYAGTPFTSTLNYAYGNQTGVARITGFTSRTVVDMEVLAAFGATTATGEWAEGQWSDLRGWPSAVDFQEGRLWWAGKDKINGSVSDGFYSFDDATVGDSGPLSRSIGSGPVDVINWMVGLQRLVLGAQGAEFSCRSTSLDEPLTPTNFNLKRSTGQGSSTRVVPIKIDGACIFVQRGGTRIYELAIDPSTYDYAATHLSAVIPEIGRPGISRAAVQRQPETRCHFVRTDGTAAVLTFDKAEQLVCWTEMETDGAFEDVVVLPGAEGEEEDAVYYTVRRTINGATVRYLERLATEVQCRPNDAGTLTTSYLGDALKVYSGAPATAITGLDHLEGEQVVVWADGADVGYDDSDALIYTVTGGQITLATAASNVMVGLPYNADWESSKLLQLAQAMGQPMTKYKEIYGLGLVLADTHARGLKFGRNFTDLDSMPSTEVGYDVDPDLIHTDYEGDGVIFPGDFSTDERLCLRAMAPRPCTVLAAIAGVKANQ